MTTATRAPAFDGRRLRREDLHRAAADREIMVALPLVASAAAPEDLTRVKIEILCSHHSWDRLRRGHGLSAESASATLIAGLTALLTGPLDA